MTQPTMTPQQLTARREALGLSQAQLSRALRVTESTISRWESGGRKILMAGVVDRALRDLEQEIGGDQQREAFMAGFEAGWGHPFGRPRDYERDEAYERWKQDQPQ